MGDLNGIIQAIMELIVAGIVGVIFYSIKKNEFDQDESGKDLEKMYILLFAMLIIEGVAYLIRRLDGGFAAFFVRTAQFLIYEANFAMAFLYFQYLKASLPREHVGIKIKRGGYAIYGLLYVGAVLVIVNLFVKMLYDFDASNRIQKNNLFNIYLLIIALTNIIDFVLLYMHKEYLPKKKFWVLSSYCFLPFLAVALNFFSYGIAFGTFSIAAALVINFEYIMSSDDDEDDDEETDDMIPFEIERAHVESYIELEQERLGDKIQVDWDVKVTDFTLPPLSLQRFVENAIRYGVGRKYEGGLVVIKVEEKIGEIQISVADDGRGFDLSKLTESSDHYNSAHTAILEVEKNLKYACNGTIEITSTPNVGTLAKIHIPR